MAKTVTRFNGGGEIVRAKYDMFIVRCRYCFPGHSRRKHFKSFEEAVTFWREHRDSPEHDKCRAYELAPATRAARRTEQEMLERIFGDGFSDT